MPTKKDSLISETFSKQGSGYLANWNPTLGNLEALRKCFCEHYLKPVF